MSFRGGTMMSVETLEVLRVLGERSSTCRILFLLAMRMIGSLIHENSTRHASVYSMHGV